MQKLLLPSLLLITLIGGVFPAHANDFDAGKPGSGIHIVQNDSIQMLSEVLKAQKRSKELIVEIEKGVNSATLPEPPKLSDDTITHLKLIETTLLSIAGVNPEGVASSDAMNAQPLRNVKTECAGLGFKPKTEKFADCMLQLTE
jgi:hypothetical protein